MSLDAEKAFDKIPHAFVIKYLSKLRIEVNVPNLIKNILLLQHILKLK